MNRLFVLFSMLLLLASGLLMKAPAQIFLPFQSDSTFWTETDVRAVSLNPPVSEYTELGYSIHDDTTINNYAYHKAWWSWDTTFTGGIQYLGAIRADSQRVYFLPADSSRSVVLYDWTLAPGDSFMLQVTHAFQGNTYCYAPDSFQVVIGQIDTIMLGGLSRRRWRIAGPDWTQNYIIEGFGCIISILNPGHQGVGPDHNHYMPCYKHKNLSYDGEFGFRSCGILLETDPETGVADQIKVGPNPVRDVLNIQLPNGAPAQASLFNLNGRQVRSGHTTSAVLRMETQDLKPGLYLLEVRPKTGFYRTKILITR